MEPAEGAGASTSGIESAAQVRSLSSAGLVERERRRRHGEAGEAAGLATQRRHLVHGAQRGAAEGARDDDRLAGAGEHGGELGQVHDLVGYVLGQAHRHHEVDVRQPLAQGRVLLDVGKPGSPASAGLGVGDVQAVGAGAVVRASLGQLESLGRAAARRQRRAARRARQRLLRQGPPAAARACPPPVRRPWRTARGRARGASRRRSRRAGAAWPGGLRRTPRRPRLSAWPATAAPTMLVRACDHLARVGAGSRTRTAATCGRSCDGCRTSSPAGHRRCRRACPAAAAGRATPG